MEAARTAEQEWTEEYRSKLPGFEKEAVKTGDKREKKAELSWPTEDEDEHEDDYEDEDEKKILQILMNRNFIQNIEPKYRTTEQLKQLRKLQTQLKNFNIKVEAVLLKFPHLKKTAPMTAAKRKAAQTSKLTEDEREAARKVQQKRTEAYRSNIPEDEREAARNRDLKRKTAEEEQEQEQDQDQEQQLMQERKIQQLPRRQQLLRLENPLYVCYANAGTNALLSSPCVTRLLSSLPNYNAQFNTVRQLARLQPSHLTNLKELRCIVTQNTNIDFNQDNRMQDASEWITALHTTIEAMLNGDLKKNFTDLFKLESTLTFECHQNHQSQRKEVKIILRLSVVDQEQHPLLSLSEILMKNFQEEMIERRCDTCNSGSSKKTEIITKYPQVLLLQYMRFTNEEYKIDHNIICGTLLKLYNATYKLTGIVVHQGSSTTRGHYYTITRCWETGKAYKLNDAEFPKNVTR